MKEEKKKMEWRKKKKSVEKIRKADEGQRKLN